MLGLVYARIKIGVIVRIKATWDRRRVSYNRAFFRKELLPGMVSPVIFFGGGGFFQRVFSVI